MKNESVVTCRTYKYTYRITPEPRGYYFEVTVLIDFIDGKLARVNQDCGRREVPEADQWRLNKAIAEEIERLEKVEAQNKFSWDSK